ncbi:MAG: DMT family transporter, partial [Myxococcota bacterium]|nr:DMT family transporter [Myxococcota bacterium]
MAHSRDSDAPVRTGGLLAVLAAFSFGVTTPLVQRLGHGAGPVPTATLLYAGAALASIHRVGGNAAEAPLLRPRHIGRLVAVAFAGALFAPACLAWGLQHTSGVGASLLLNFEGVLTVVLAWLVFGEPVGSRVVVAMLLMVVGGALLVLGGSAGSVRLGFGAGAVVLATLGWAVDNTLTRPLAHLDASQVVRWKATLGACFGLALSWALEQPFPGRGATLGLLVCGATGYGISLRLYLLAQRQIGAGRTGSIFATAPFIGALAASAFGDRTAGPATWTAGVLFGSAVVLHLTERHRHAHLHAAMVHEHLHRHDDGHHHHDHRVTITGAHGHVHQHESLAHDHAHCPDLHHA